MKFNWSLKSFLVVLVAAVLFGSYYFKFFATKERDCSKVPKEENAVVIKMENNSFDPKELTVNVCDTLLFLNLDEIARWPKSEQFDAGRELKKYDFFQHQVTRIGEESFYDYLHQEIAGKIFIKEIK